MSRLNLKNIKSFFEEVQKLNREYEERVNISEKEDKLEKEEIEKADKSVTPEGISSFTEYVNKFDPQKIVSLLRVFLFQSESRVKKDIQSFGDTIEKANKQFQYDQSTGTSLVVQFIVYKVILVALHRYIRSIPELRKQQGTVDVFFKTINLLGTAEFHLSFADRKVREFYYNITRYVVLLLFEKDGEKKYSNEEVIKIVNEIVENYENICEANRRNNVEFSELLILTKCIIDRFLNEYSANYFNFPVIDKDNSYESFEDAIIGISGERGDIISLPHYRPTSARRDYDVRR